MTSANKQVSVVISRDGPYIVSGDAPLTEEIIGANAEGESMQWQRGKANEEGYETGQIIAKISDGYYLAQFDCWSFGSIREASTLNVPSFSSGLPRPRHFLVDCRCVPRRAWPACEIIG